MKSRIDENHYVIQENDHALPIKVRRNRAKKTLKKIIASLEIFQAEIDSLYNCETAFYSILEENIIGHYTLGFDEGESWKVDYITRQFKSLLDDLESNNDYIPKQEDVTTLSSMGYIRDIGYKYRWERILEDSDEREVVDEIITKDFILRRKRVIEWETDGSSKHSKSIKYKKLPIGKKLMKAIENTIRSDSV